MNHPTIKQIEEADEKQLGAWHKEYNKRYLMSPPMDMLFYRVYTHIIHRIGYRDAHFGTGYIKFEKQ